ncbi:MAG: tRNA (guanosine(46)-N7)-methyltransferase TrmB [Clostridiaceae bacterium]
MRLRKKWWARPEMEENQIFIADGRKLKGNWTEEFKNDNPIYLELGCGRGKFILEWARENKNINFIAVDLKDEVLIYVLRKIKEEELANVRVLAMDIWFIDEIFDKDEIGRIFINFCNPWPKLRHNKRRLTHSKFLNKYKLFLKNRAEIWFKTDDKPLFDDSLQYFKDENFDIEYFTYDLENTDYKENVMTEYETKFTHLGMKIMFLKAKLNI